jgi:hypothetical protein
MSKYFCLSSEHFLDFSRFLHKPTEHLCSLPRRLDDIMAPKIHISTNDAFKTPYNVPNKRLNTSKVLKEREDGLYYERLLTQTGGAESNKVLTASRCR